MTARPTPRQLKILLVGDTATGKDSYVRRLKENKFSNDIWTNKECDISSLKIKIDEDTEVSIQIFNIHGAERGKTKIKQYFKNIDGYIIMFDVTQAASYDHILNWKSNVDAENESGKPRPCILLANKCDLEKDQEVESQMEEINNYCEVVGFRSYFETSCKDNIGIQSSIQYLIREIMRSPDPSIPDNDLRPPTPVHDEIEEIPNLPPKDIVLKILVIGELGTGKTAVIQRYTRNTYSGNYLATIGADLAFKKVPYNNGVINVHLWDIAGDERFGAMTHLFYKDAAGCLIVFDVSRASTLNGASKWKEDFDMKVNFDEDNQIPCLLIGNKCDLQKDGIVKSETHMIDFCHRNQFNRWFETSAKTNTNIVDAFSCLINQIMENNNNRTRGRSRTFSEPITVGDPTRPRPAESSCCRT